jgi:hypothetical protein
VILAPLVITAISDVALAPPVITAISTHCSHVVTADIGAYQVILLVDSGSDVCALRRDVVQTLGLTYVPANPAFKSTSGHRLDVVGEFTVKFYLGERTFSHDFAVIDISNTNWFGILGTDFLAENQGDVLITQKKLQFPNGSVPLVQKSPFDCVSHSEGAAASSRGASPPEPLVNSVNIELPQMQSEPCVNSVQLDRPLKLSPQAHTLFYVHTDWAKGKTLSLTLPTDSRPDVGITPCVAKANEKGETPVLFYNNTDRCVTLQRGELDFIAADICTVESEWSPPEHHQRSEYSCFCHSTAKGLRVPKGDSACLVCSKAHGRGDPLLWPEPPEPTETDAEFLALFNLGKDHFNCHKELTELLLSFKDIFM